MTYSVLDQVIFDGTRLSSTGTCVKNQYLPSQFRWGRLFHFCIGLLTECVLSRRPIGYVVMAATEDSWIRHRASFISHAYMLFQGPFVTNWLSVNAHNREKMVKSSTITHKKIHERLARWRNWKSCDVGEAKERLENELWHRWSDGRVGEWAVT